LTVWNIKSLYNLNNSWARCLDKRPFGEVHSRWFSQEVTLLLQVRGCHYLIYESFHRATFYAEFIQYETSHTILQRWILILIPPSTLSWWWYCPFQYSKHILLCILDISHEFYLLYPSHLWLDLFEQYLISTDRRFPHCAVSLRIPILFLGINIFSSTFF
jgi:hypothetical protein